jgi:uncharacterized protein (TIGR03067 family)
MPPFLLTAALLLSSSTGREPVVLDRLEGEWRIQSWIQSGIDRMMQPNVAGVPDRWVFRRGIMTIYSGEQVLVTDLKIVINENASPKTFSISYVGTDEALKQRYQNGVRGICRFERDTWIRCYHTDWRQLPEKFESPAGAGFILQTMKRLPAGKAK